MSMQRRSFLAGLATGIVATPLANAKDSARMDPRLFDKRALTPEASLQNGDKSKFSQQYTHPFVTCFGCTTQCGVHLKVENGQKVVRVTGNPYHPLGTIAPQPMSTAIDDALANLGLYSSMGQTQRASVCGRGACMLELMHAPQRIYQPMKRVGARNSGKWQTISWEQLIQETVYGGDLFGEGHVPGLLRLRDLSTPIDPHASELGPKVNQVGVMMSTNDGRDRFSRRFWNHAYGTINYVGHGSWCGGSYRSGSGAVFGDHKKMPHGKPDFANARFILFIGTAPGQAGNPFKRTAEWIAKGRTEGQLSYVVVDPVMNQSINASAGARNLWLPILPGTDGALVMALMQVMFAKDRIHKDYLACPNLELAQKNHHASFSTASWLIYADPKHPKYGRYVRPSDLGIDAKDAVGVVIDDAGLLFPAKTMDHPAKIFVDQRIRIAGKSVRVTTALRQLRKASNEHTLDEYAAICGIAREKIEWLAQEFTSHGTKASAVAHGGMMTGSGFYNAFGVVSLNVLIGNVNASGGFVMNAAGFNDASAGPCYDLANFAGKVKPRGIPLGRNVPFEKTTRARALQKADKPLRSAQPWFPNAPGLGTEWFTSMLTGYPYDMKALILWMCNPIYGMPALEKLAKPILSDPKKLPLIIGIDCFINESNTYADYLVPDSFMYESWGWITPWNGITTKAMAARHPVVDSPVGKTPDGQPMSMETYLIALAKRMKLPGFGPDAICDMEGNAFALSTPQDWYFKAGANIAKMAKVTATPTERDLRLTGFDRWVSDLKRRVKPTEWAQVAFLYTRGGYFESQRVLDGGKSIPHRFTKPLFLWNEKLATSTNAMKDERWHGCAHYQEPSFADGSSVQAHYPTDEWPLKLVSFKSVLHSSYSLNTSLSAIHAENAILMHPNDAAHYQVHSGDTVRVATPQASVCAKVLVDAGIKEGVLGIEHGFGHKRLESTPITIDGKRIPAHPKASRGFNINDIGLLDPSRRHKALWVDAVSGACVRNGLPAKIEVLKS